MIAATDVDSEVQEMLNDLYLKYRTEEHTIRQPTKFWKNQLRKARKDPLGLQFEVNTLYKTKDKKVQPISDSQIKPDKVEGRPDWKSRAASQQKPNKDSDWRSFEKYFEPRYAEFPRGTRLTRQRISELKIGTELKPREKEMLVEMLYRREPALAWDFSESGRVNPEVTPPIKLNVVPHQAWQEKQFPVPRKLRDVVREMIQQRLDRETLEYSKSPYRNPWFLVAKKDAGYRLINNAQKINSVTVRDANLPPNPDEFSEEFAGCHIVSLIDFFSGYDQVELHVDSRPLTAFATPLGLVQQCTLPMGTTNSVAEFIRVVTKILQDQIPYRCLPYMDDIAVKGPKTDYDEEEIEPGIRRFIAKHLCNLDCVLADMERAGVTASGAKSDWCFSTMAIVGYMVNKNGRFPQEKKVNKIREWPPCQSPKELRMFIGVCVYYRIWIMDFARGAEPLFRLLRKEIAFEWTSDAEAAMNWLKEKITNAPVLISIDYSEPLRAIIISVDGSKKGWGAVIHQIDNRGQRKPVRFESGVWSKSERNWDSGKHECKALLLALKKFRPYIYGVHFTVETDSRTLIAQLNRSATDLPGALITRWLALLNMWEFDIKHVEGKKNVVADGLSRRAEPQGWTPPDEPEEDVESFIDKHLGSATLHTMSLYLGPQVQYLGNLEHAFYVTNISLKVLDNLCTDEFLDIARWLTTLKRPKYMTRAEYAKLRKTARRYRVVQDYLWLKTSGDRPLRRVIDKPEEQQRIIRALHEESGHRGIEGTWRKISYRYHWPHLYDQVRSFIKTCEECQFHATRRYDEELHPTWGTDMIWGWVTIDVVYMPDGKLGKKFLVVARDYTSGWPEAKALAKNDSEEVAKFLDEYIFSRWGIPYRLSVDGGPENKGLVTDLAKQYGIERVVASAYHPQGQGLIERGHKELVGALKKMKGNWVDNLHRALWADRVTVKRSTGETPAFLIGGREHVLPIELCIPTWQTIPWDEVHDTESLIAARARQFERRDSRLQEAIDRSVRLREQGKEWFDAKAHFRPEELKEGDLVLVRDTLGDMDMSRLTKLKPKWKGPYKISRIPPDRSGWYQLEDLDGARFRNKTPGNRITKFFQRATEELEQKNNDTNLVEDTSAHTETLPQTDTLLDINQPPVNPLFRRRSERLGQKYAQDVPNKHDGRNRARQLIEVRIPARRPEFDPKDFEIYDKWMEEEAVSRETRSGRRGN